MSEPEPGGRVALEAFSSASSYGKSCVSCVRSKTKCAYTSVGSCERYASILCSGETHKVYWKSLLHRVNENVLCV